MARSCPFCFSMEEGKVLLVNGTIWIHQAEKVVAVELRVRLRVCLIWGGHVGQSMCPWRTFARRHTVSDARALGPLRMCLRMACQRKSRLQSNILHLAMYWDSRSALCIASSQHKVASMSQGWKDQCLQILVPERQLVQCSPRCWCRRPWKNPTSDLRNRSSRLGPSDQTCRPLQRKAAVPPFVPTFFIKLRISSELVLKHVETRAESVSRLLPQKSSGQTKTKKQYVQWLLPCLRVSASFNSSTSLVAVLWSRLRTYPKIAWIIMNRSHLSPCWELANLCHLGPSSRSWVRASLWHKTKAWHRSSPNQCPRGQPARERGVYSSRPAFNQGCRRCLPQMAASGSTLPEMTGKQS